MKPTIRPWMIGLAALLLLGGVGLAAGGARIGWWAATTQTSVPATATSSHPLHWDDTNTRMRFSDGTSDNYVPACVPTTTGDVCSWNATSSTWQRSAAGGTGNWTFSGNNADLTAAGTMGIAPTTATALSIGGSSLATVTATATSYYLFGYGNTGGLPFVIGNATASAGTPLISSPILEARAAYWTGAASSNDNLQIQHVIDSTTPTSHTTFSEGAGGEVLRTTWDGTNRAVLFPAAAKLGNSAQAATNTTALTIAPNVADGASTIVLAVNSATALANSGAEYQEWQNNGTRAVGLKVGNTYPYFSGNATGLGMYDSGVNNGVAVVSGALQVVLGGAVQLTATSQLQRGSMGEKYNHVAKSGAYAITINDYLISTDTTSGAFTVTLPAPGTVGAGATYIIYDATNQWGTHNLTVARNASESINGSASNLTLSTAGQRCVIWTNGTNWFTMKTTD